MGENLPRVWDGDEDLAGKICVCSTGRVGIVTGFGHLGDDPDGPEVWRGIGFDGKGTWASSKPIVVADDPEEFRVKLSSRFGGKMSYLG